LLNSFKTVNRELLNGIVFSFSADIWLSALEDAAKTGEERVRATSASPVRTNRTSGKHLHGETSMEGLQMVRVNQAASLPQS
jgi:hypothetical protein